MILIALFGVSFILGYTGFFKQRQTLSAVPAEVEQGFLSHFHKAERIDQPITQYFQFIGRDGQIFGPKDFKNQIVLINLWATWCTPCLKEIPSLIGFQERYPDIQLYAISVDEGKSLKYMQEFLELNGFAALAPYLEKEASVQSALGSEALPSSYLISSNGRILYRFIGDGDWMSEDAIAFFDALIDQNQ